MRKITFEPQYGPYMVNQRHGGCYVEIVDRIMQLTEWMTGHYARTFMMHFILRYPGNKPVPPKNDDVMNFCRRFVYFFSRKNIPVNYLWVREESDPGRHNYHQMVFTDGSKKYSAREFLERADIEWSRAIQDNTPHLIQHCTRSPQFYEYGFKRNPRDGLMIDRYTPHFQAAVNEAVYWGSYLAKVRSKENNPPGLRTWNSSQPRNSRTGKSPL